MNTFFVQKRKIAWLPIVLLGCWLGAHTVWAVEYGVPALEYTNKTTNGPETRIYNGTTIPINPKNGQVTLLAVGMVGTRIQVFEGANKLHETDLLTASDSFSFGDSLSTGKKIPLTFTEGVHTITTKILWEDDTVAKTYDPITFLVDTTPPSVTVLNDSVWQRNAPWVGNELIALFANVSDGASGINTNPGSVEYTLKDLTKNAIINKPTDTVTYSDNKFSYTPGGGFKTGTFTNGRQYRLTMHVYDQAGNKGTGTNTFNFDNDLNWNQFFVRVQGIWDPKNPQCSANAQCKTGGTYPGYMPFTSNMVVYTNPTHLLIKINPAYISKWMNGPYLVGVGDYLSPWEGKGWQKFDPDSTIAWSNPQWYNQSQGLFKTKSFTRPIGAVNHFLYFRDSAYNRTTPHYYYTIDASAGGLPPAPKITSLVEDIFWASPQTSMIIPTISGTAVGATKVEVTISGISGIYATATVSGNKWSIPSNGRIYNKQGAVNINAYAVNEFGRSPRNYIRRYVDSLPPKLESININSGDRFVIKNQPTIKVVVSDAPYISMPYEGPLSLNTEESDIVVFDKDGNEIARDATWVNNHDGTYNAELDLSALNSKKGLPEGEYKILVYMIDQMGNVKNEWIDY